MADQSLNLRVLRARVRHTLQRVVSWVLAACDERLRRGGAAGQKLIIENVETIYEPVYTAAVVNICSVLAQYRFASRYELIVEQE